MRCRHDRCELVLSGDADGLGTALAHLETREGLNGLAQAIHLTVPVAHGERMTLRAYAQFDRSAD